ncbi:YfcZ/YiiS family protein [Vibrio cyclitrophicus]
MSQDNGNNDVCEACGCAGEIGFIIKEGDEVAEVKVNGSSKALIEAEFAKYVELAKQVSSNVEFETSEMTEDSTELQARFKFEVSAEKIIFELKTRSLAR